MKRVLMVSLMATGLGLGCAHAPKPTAPTGASSANVNGSAPSNGNVITETDGTSKEAGVSGLDGAVLHFPFNRSELTDDSRSRLDKIANALKKNSKVAIRIAGNADERGTEEYNMSLGQERADAARDYLRRLGVDISRVQTISYGEVQPIDSSHTEEAWSKNRRDDISIQK